MPTINDYRNKYPSLKPLDDDALISRVAEVQGVSREDVMAHMGYKPKPRGMLSALNDTVIEAANAVAGGVKSVGDFVAPGNPVSEYIDENIIKAGEASQSDVVKAEKARYRAEMEGAQGIGDEVSSTLGYVARNPVQSLAQAAGSFVLPGAAVKGGGMLASMAGAGAKGLTRAGLAGGAVAGAALSGGDAAGTAYDLVKKAGGTEEQAVEAARKASVLPAAIGAAGGVMGAEKLLAGGKGFAGGAAARALKTAGAEGMQEAIEEGVTQYEGQAAAAPYDPTIDPMKGVAGAATMGAVLGGATGGAVSLLEGGHGHAPKPDPVLSVLSAPSVDDAINAATAAVSAKPAQKAQAPAELPQMDADDRREVLGLLQVVNRPGVSPNVARFAQSRMDALLAPYRTIPAGEVTEMLPVPDARELTDEERAEYANAVPFSYRRAMARGLPQPEVSDVGVTPQELGLAPTQSLDAEGNAIPVGEAQELYRLPRDLPVEVIDPNTPPPAPRDTIPAPVARQSAPIPTGEATELDPETIQPTDLLAKDGEPFVSKTGAQARAFASGGGKVVTIPNHFGSGQPGYVVRPLVPARPNNTRGTNAADVARPGGQRADDRSGSDGVAGVPDQRPSDVLASPAATEGQGVAGAGTAGGGSAEPAALSAEQAIRTAVDSVQGRVVGSWHPISVSHNGRDQQFLSNVKRVVSDGKGPQAVSLAQIKPGRLLTGEPLRPLFYGYRLTRDNKLVEEGIPREASEAEIKRWESAFGGKLASATTTDTAPTFTEGQRVTLNGTPYTVTSANNSAVKLQGEDGATKMVARNSKTFGQIQAEAAPAPAPAAGGFDAEAWDKARADRIKASREAGNTHLDQVPAYVETMRGKDVYYVHDPKVRGRVLTVDNNGNVYVEWLDQYSQDKEGATPMKMGKRQVMQSSLGPRDLKDYVAGKPTQEPNEAARPQPEAQRAEAAAPAAAPAPAAPAVVPGATSGALEADGVKREPWTLTREEAAKEYPGDEYDRMLNRHSDLGDIPYAEADRRARVNAMGQRKLWAKTRKQLEQEGKDAVKAARGDRAAINKLKGTPAFANWRIRTMSANGKQAIADAERLAREYLAIHKDRVQEALMEGKDVPAEVLADYPDLKRPAPQPTSGEAAPAPAAPAVVPGAGGAAVQANGVKAPESALRQALRSVGIDPDAPRDKAKDKARGLRKQADELMNQARKMLEGIPPGQPVRSTRDANLRERAREKTRKAADLQREADALEAAPQPTSGEAAPAPAPEAERTPKAQAVKEALAAKKGEQPKRDEYPLGKTDREDRFFGTRVRVLPELKGDAAWEGTIQSTLNGGRLFTVKRGDSDARPRIGGDRLEILEVKDAEKTDAKPAGPTKAPASINMLPLSERWDALVAHTKTDGGDPDKGQRSYRALTQFIGRSYDKPADVWDRWSSFIGSADLVNRSAAEVVKWMESNLPTDGSGYARGMPGASMSSTNAGDVGYWQKNLAELERREPDHNRYVNRLEQQVVDVEEVGGDEARIDTARKAIDSIKRQFASNRRTIEQGLQAAERREKDEADAAAAAEAAAYKPYDAKELSKKPTPASMSGWFTANYEGKTVWTNGTILDLSGEPPHLAGYESRRDTLGRNKDGKLDVSRVIPRERGPEAVPFGFYDGEFGKTAKNGVVYFDAEGRLVGADATLFRYFASKFKGATFYASPNNDVLTVRQDGKTVGVLMPIKLGTDAQPAPSVEELRTKIAAKPASVPAPAPQPEAEAPAPAEPWQMTKDEFVAEVRRGRDFKQLGTNPAPLSRLRGAGDWESVDRQARNHHAARVAVAVAEGKDVPAEVLSEYPGLKRHVEAGAMQPTREDRRRAAAEAVRKATVQRTNANSAMVWQIIGPDGNPMSGPPGKYPGNDGPLAGTATMGQLGWKTKRDADAALAELNRKADEILGAVPAPAAPAEAPKAEQAPAEQAAAILNAAAEPPKGAERLSVIKDVKAGAITPDEVAAAYPAKEDAAPAEPVKPNTEDAGAELSYNRRNRVKSGLKWDDIAKKNDALKVKEAIKQNVYPRPDYQALVDGGMPALAAHLVKQAYDAIAAKPNTRGAPTDADLQTYIAGVNRVMAGVMAWANDPVSLSKWASREARSAGAMLGKAVSISELAGDGKTMLQLVYPDGWKANQAEVVVLGANKLLGALQPGYTEARRASKAVSDGWPASQEAWEKRGIKIVYADKIDVAYYEGKGGRDGQPYVSLSFSANGSRLFDRIVRGVESQEDPQVKALVAEELAANQGKFIVMDKARRMLGRQDTEEAAKDVAREVTKREGKSGPDEAGIDVGMATREGAPRRLPGEDISSERLKEAFGLKGVNFGNWMKGDTPALRAERQAHLNHAYDAFMDLADVLGLPPKAMSLNGMLGFAIGAQGNGRFAAHFVPGLNEINLTRASGAGSLAHEFGHALDHYFAEQAGFAKREEPFLTEHTTSVNRKVVMENGRQKLVLDTDAQAIRPEIVERFKAIVQAMNKRPETLEEFTARQQRGKTMAKESVRRWLDAIKRDYVKAGVDEAAVDAINARILALELGEGKVSVSSSLYVSPPVDELRTLYRKAAGRVPPIDQIKSLQANLDHFAYVMSERAGALDHVPQQVGTEYARNAAALDKDKGGKPYWSTNLEKFARAFDAYVSDELEARAAKNTYLSHAGRQNETVPTGDERTAINKAIARLIASIEAVPSEGGNLRLVGKSDAAIARDALAQVKPEAAEVTALEREYGAQADTEPFHARLAQDVSDYITKGAQAVADAVRAIVGKVAKVVLSVAVVFNVAGLNPQFSSESYARTVAAMPRTVTVTERVQLKQAGKADVNGRTLTPAATKVVDWIGAQNRPSEVSLVLDPEAGRMYVLRGGKIEADAPALFGKQGVGAVSDATMNKVPDEMTDADKMTPAGRFPLALEDSGSIITFARAPNGNSVYGFHRVYLGDPAERRQQRLDSATASDNAVSFGCVNVGTEFYNTVLKRFNYNGDAYGYLIPSDPSQLDALMPLPAPLTTTRTTTYTDGVQQAGDVQGRAGGDLGLIERRRQVAASARRRLIDGPKPGDDADVRFSRAPGVAKDVANAWRILSENDEVFTYAKSDSTDFAEIANGTGAIFAEPEPGSVGADVERAWRVYPLDDGGQPDKSKPAYVIHYKSGAVQLTIKNFAEGDAGSAAYAAVGNYAFNNGIVFEPDGFGLTQAAIERRLENLISLALKFGSTDFIRLSPNQLKAFKMTWRDGDTAFNTEQMLMASYNALVAKFPEIKDYTYDLNTGARKSDVGAVGRDEPGTAGIVARAREAGARAGQATVARAIFTNTFAAEPTGKARRELVRRLGDGYGRALGDNALAKSLYSRAEPGRTGVPMADAKAVVATIREALPTAPEIVLHDSVRRAPENLRRLIRQAGADNDVEAVYHDGEIHVFPGNIASIERMQFVVAHHEVRHHGLRSMLGPQMGPAMLRMYASNPNLKAAADAKMAAGLADTRILAVEEALADMPVEDLQKLTGWQRIVSAARQWLRQVAARLRRAGMNTLADALEPEGWTDADIAAVVQRAEDVSRGGAAPFRTGGTVFGRDENPDWYSALADQVGKASMNAGPSNAWKALLKNWTTTGKVKADEVEWSGLNEWLDMTPGKITKAQVADYLRANGVQVTETVLGDGLSHNTVLGLESRLNDLGWTVDDEGFTRQSDGALFYYDGGWVTDDEDAEPMSAAARDLVEQYTRSVDDDGRPAGSTKYANYTLPGGTNYREVLLTLPTERESQRAKLFAMQARLADLRAPRRMNAESEAAYDARIEQARALQAEIEPLAIAHRAAYEAGTSTEYRSNHWDQPNILAHIRLNDRTDADGARVLFVEEVQSDFAQDKRRGKTDVAAPYIDATDKWVTLALKRVIKMAVDGGYDKVAFVTGEQSADRYDLSKQVSRVSWNPKTGELGTMGLDKLTMTDVATGVKAEQLADYIGKDAADKLMAADENDRGFKVIAGDDLKVGGSGMRAFYNKIVPAVAKDVLRKLGGGAMEMVQVSVGNKPANPEALQFQIDHPEMYGAETRRLAAQELAGKTAEQPGFTITQAMRDKALGGMPLFSRADQTQTPAFRRWFGDSKVVDAEGKPLVVYHGTSADFNVFDKGQVRRPYFGDGFHFAEAPSPANFYADRGGGNVMPVYLRIKNPYSTPNLSAEMEKRGLNPFSRPAWEAFSEQLQDEGYDGLTYDDGATMPKGKGGKAWVAFRPEQIKSAIGNNGDFSPDSADIRFSRSPGASKATAQRQVTQAVRNTVADFLGDAGAKVSWWDKTLGTQYAKAQKFPAYRRVFDAVQQYLEDTSAMANEAADQAKGILPKLETWKDLRNFGLKPADAKAIAAPIFTGTLTDQKVYSDDELRARFNLTPEQIGQYRQFRATVDTSLDQAMAAEALRMLGDKNAGLRELALTDREALREGIEQFLTQQAIDAGEDVDAQGVDRGEFTLLRDDIAEKYQRIDDLKAQGYAPLMRFGKYKVNVTDRETGETLFFGLYESKAAANSALRDMQGDPEFQGADFEQGVLSQEQYKLFSAMPLDSLEMFAEAIGADQSAVFQDFIRLAKSNRSAMKRLLKRKGTAGFSEDVPRVLAAFVTSNARMASGALNMPSAKEAAQNIRDGDVQDEAIKLLDVVQNPTDTAGAVRSLMFVNFLGGSIASAVVNLTQPLTMTLPYLSQFGGGVKAAARLMAAGKMVASGKVNDMALRVALKRAETDGIVSPQEIHHLQAQAMGTFGTHPLLQRAAFVWGAPFSLAEQFNRRVSFIAAFQTAREQGIDDPFAFAEKAVIETQGLYSKANAPNLARGAIGAAALTFRQFSIHYLEWMGRMWKSGPQGKKAVGMALALLILAAGTDGLPFADDLDDLIDTLGQALGYDMNVKRTRREFVAEQLGLGDMAADVMARGFSAVPGVPLDVSLRMSMGNLLPGTGLFLRSNTDKSRDLLEIAGPAGGLAKQYIEAGTKALRGDIGGAAQSALPVAFQNAFKATEMWSTGEARDTLGRKVMDADAVDGLMKFIGFQPQAIARESEKIQMIRNSEQLAKNVEGEIAGAWARAIVDKDADGVAEARAKLARWNEDNPESPIRIKMQQIITRAKKLREDRASRFITSVSPERRRAVAEALE